MHARAVQAVRNLLAFVDSAASRILDVLKRSAVRGDKSHEETALIICPLLLAKRYWKISNKIGIHKQVPVKNTNHPFVDLRTANSGDFGMRCTHTDMRMSSATLYAKFWSSYCKTL